MVAVTKDYEVEFRFFRPEAREVCIAGDFNRWNRSQMPMQRQPDGYWTARAKLPPGVFRFRYFADGQPFPDYAAFGLIPGPYGPDSLILVHSPTPLPG